jgi:low affinity Fe/Cu permease
MPPLPSPDPIAIPGTGSWFDKFARVATKFTGRPVTFILAVGLLLAWAASYPLFLGLGDKAFDTWQLVINTVTTIVTFLMVFLIQNGQNRDAAAVQLKLDELIRTSQGAHNAMIDLEALSEAELEAIRAKYEAMAKAAREKLRQGERDDDCPDVPDLDANPKG